MSFVVFYCAGDKIESNEMGGACRSEGERRGMYRILMGKPEGKRSLGTPRCRWEDNINGSSGSEKRGYGLD
jgi:hypothetical protein